MKLQRSGALVARPDTQLPNMEAVFAGGDCCYRSRDSHPRHCGR